MGIWGGPALNHPDHLLPPSPQSRAAGTVGARPARHAAAAMQHATAAPSASTRTGRSTTTCAARVCRAPRPWWLTRCLDSPMPLPAWAPACPRAPPAPVKLAPRGLLAPALLAHWMPHPADPSQTRCSAHGHAPTDPARPQPPDTAPGPGSPTIGVTAATASLQKKTQNQQKLHSTQLPQLPEDLTQQPLQASSEPPTEL